jgi:hypothetical protein
MSQKVFRELLEVMKSRGGPYAGLDIPEFFALAEELFNPKEADRGSSRYLLRSVALRARRASKGARPRP